MRAIKYRFRIERNKLFSLFFLFSISVQQLLLRDHRPTERQRIAFIYINIFFIVSIIINTAVHHRNIVCARPISLPSCVWQLRDHTLVHFCLVRPTWKKNNKEATTKSTGKIAKKTDQTVKAPNFGDYLRDHRDIVPGARFQYFFHLLLWFISSSIGAVISVNAPIYFCAHRKKVMNSKKSK